MDWKLEVVPIPVSDVDRAKHFYNEQVGFLVDLNTQLGDERRFVQLTPPGSGCSIQVSTGILNMPPGCWRACSSSSPTLRPPGLNWSSGAWKPALSNIWTTVSGLRGEAEIGTPSSSSAIRTTTAGSYRSAPLAISQARRWFVGTGQQRGQAY